MQITIYTDGACDIHGANQPGGWAAIAQAMADNGDVLKETVLSGGAENTTNNQMELTAVIQGLKALKHPSSVTVFTDSRYVIDIARGRKRVLKNKALWRDFHAAAAGHGIRWKFVLGHSGDKLNERCDRLAVAEKRKFALPDAQQASDAEPTSASGVQIYLSTQYSGKDKATAWAAIVRTGDALTEFSGRLPDTSELEGTLIGAIKCLEEHAPAGDATLYTAQEYLAKGMNQWLAGWQARRWKTRGGAPVKHAQRWKALQRLAGARSLRFRFVKHRDDNPYFQRGKALAAEILRGV